MVNTNILKDGEKKVMKKSCRIRQSKERNHEGKICKSWTKIRKKRKKENETENEEIGEKRVK